MFAARNQLGEVNDEAERKGRIRGTENRMPEDARLHDACAGHPSRRGDRGRDSKHEAGGPCLTDLR